MHSQAFQLGNGDFVLVWASGHDDPRPVYYRENTEGHWGATYNRDEAKRFPSAAAAIKRYLSLHTFPEDYERFIHNGTVRAEHYKQPQLFT